MVTLSGKIEGIFALYQIGVCHIPARYHGKKQDRHLAGMTNLFFYICPAGFYLCKHTSKYTKKISQRFL
jgi:hypothetical protein